MKQNTHSGLDNASCSTPSLRNGITYLLIGGGIGATLALLFAPKPGSQLRGDIADVTRKGYDATLNKARVLNEKTGDFAHTVKEKADAVYSFAARKAGAGIDTVTEAADEASSKVEGIINETANKAQAQFEGNRNSTNAG
jgi:gas vesicle protein